MSRVAFQRVCVFCGALPGRQAQHQAVAAELGRLLASAGIEVVFGGSAAGGMGALAEGAIQAGGRVVGVTPGFLLDSERPHRSLARLEVVADLSARKQRMFELSEAVIVLPGGTGTLNEVLEAITLKRLAVIAHTIVLINTAGYFDPLLQLLRRMIAEGFADPTQSELLQVVDDPGAALKLIRPV
jgi:uncharacterized protein (TIGR00730 family)